MRHGTPTRPPTETEEQKGTKADEKARETSQMEGNQVRKETEKTYLSPPSIISSGPPLRAPYPAGWC